MGIKNLRERLTSATLDGFLVTEKKNRRYLSGFTGSNGLLVITLTKAYLYVDGRYYEQAQAQVSEEIEVHVTPIGTKLLEQWRPSKASVWGIEGATISLAEYKQIHQIATSKQAVIQETDGWIEALRSVKEDQELLHLQEAAEVTDRVLKQALKKIQIGMTEMDLANELDYLGKKFGGEGPAFETIVASGKRTALPHAHATKERIQADQLLMIDFGVVVNGYYSDITRTFSLGKSDKSCQEVYQRVLTAQEQTINQLEVGQPLCSIDQFARRHLKADGLDNYFSHHTGHGIGLSCHEKPSLSSTAEGVLQKNMVLTIEPGVYLPGRFGVRIEDDIVMKSDGKAQQLTTFPKEWREIECRQLIY